MNTGLGIRPELFESAFEQLHPFGFFEAHSENYFGDSIARLRLLELRERHPITLHGVGLSLGRADHLDTHHLSQLKQLVDQLEPMLVSEHLAWSAYSHQYVPDLLPLPLTEESLNVMCNHIDQMQSVLGRQVLVENPSNYLLFDQLQIPEPEFLNTLAKRTGCGLLVDINNIHVSATNVGRNAQEYIDQLDAQAIGQYHLAGYTEVDRYGENVLIDTHNQTVFPPVWHLFDYAIKRHGARPTLFEWDSDFPDFQVLIDECKHADQIAQQAGEQSAEPLSVKKNSSPELASSEFVLSEMQQGFLEKVFNLEEALPEAVETHRQRIWIYQNNVYGATQDYLEELYPAVRGVVGADFFKQMTQAYIKLAPPAKGNIHLYGDDFARVLDQFSGLAELAYLADVIAYEWALHNAYFSSVADAVDPAKMNQEELLVAPVKFNQSVSLIASNFPIYQIHRQSLPDFSGTVSIELDQSQDSLLVFKRQHKVISKILTNDESIFLHELEKSDNLLQVIEGLHGSIQAETLSSMLAMVFDSRLMAINESNIH